MYTMNYIGPSTKPWGTTWENIVDIWSLSYKLVNFKRSTF